MFTFQVFCCGGSGAVGWLLAASLTAGAQPAPGPARPADALSPAFHKQRRELLRQALPARSVAVLFAAPVRNRANDVDYVYHQNPDFYYLTGYEEPDAVLVLFKEPQTINGQPGVTEACSGSPATPSASSGPAAAWAPKGRSGSCRSSSRPITRILPAPASNGPTSVVFCLRTCPPMSATTLPTPADLYDLVTTFRQQAAVPADFNPKQAELYRTMQQHGVSSAAKVRGYLESLSQQIPALRQDAYVQRYLQATTDAERRQALADQPVTRMILVPSIMPSMSCGP